MEAGGTLGRRHSCVGRRWEAGAAAGWRRGSVGRRWEAGAAAGWRRSSVGQRWEERHGFEEAAPGFASSPTMRSATTSWPEATVSAPEFTGMEILQCISTVRTTTTFPLSNAATPLRGGHRALSAKQSDPDFVPCTSNLAEHILANTDEEEDISCMDFFDHYDCNGARLKICVDQLCGGSSNVDAVSCDHRILDVKHGDLTDGEDAGSRLGDVNQQFSMERSSRSTFGWAKWVRYRRRRFNKWMQNKRLEKKITPKDGLGTNPWMPLKGREGDKVKDMGSPTEIISLKQVHDTDSSGDVHLSPSFMNLDSCTSNLDDHILANKDEEEDISCMDFFDRYDCSGNSLKIYVDQLCGGSSNVDAVSCDHPCILDVKHGDLTAGEERELKVVKALDIVRRRALTEFNTNQIPVHTRFCDFNIAFFDHDKESDIKHGTPFHKIHPSRHKLLDGSVNVISIKVAKSDVPINIYGTVVARDRNDYRCVYLFKRARDNPQLMTKRNRMLALTGPYRALGAAGPMYFEFHLKIKGKGEIDDQNFCKGLLKRNAFRSTLAQPCTYSLESCPSKERCPSTVDMVCMPVHFALEASLEISVLNGKSLFTAKISAWTSGNGQNKATEIVLYDSEVPGTEIYTKSNGSISLSRRIVAVPLNEDLVLKISVWENCKCMHHKLVLGHDVKDRTCKVGPYELQVKIIWSGVFRQHLPKMWKFIGDSLVFW